MRCGSVNTKLMKPKILCLILPILFFKPILSQAQMPMFEQVSIANALPFSTTEVKTPEVEEAQTIRKQALELFNQQDFDGLEALAAKYRASKECEPNGVWKLEEIYSAVDGSLFHEPSGVIKLVKASSLSDGSSTNAQATNSIWESRQKQLENWVTAKPESVTAHIALGRFYTDYAWNARGDKYADKVTEQAWTIFRERLGQAAIILNKAKGLKETCPGYWPSVLRLALGLQLSKARYNNLFEEARKSAPDYEEIYRSRAVYLLPRWYGDAGEWEKDLAESADRIGGENGDVIYAQVVWAMSGSDAEEGMKAKRLSWERVDRGFLAMEKKSPDSLAVISEHALLAKFADRRDTAKKYMLLTKGKVDTSIWPQFKYLDNLKWAMKE